ncbi:Uncharacterised protein [Bordetella pertussis]|nr:Uncharacterised protein [Bordetella pertussis]CFP65424.1 Uncharacterised protein [Bordetella pertussis]CFW43373.1 Uncharacterised protein [Bordetella pertussis]
MHSSAKFRENPQNLPRSLENIYKLMNTKEKYELIADAKPSQAGTTLKAHTLVSVFSPKLSTGWKLVWISL